MFDPAPSFESSFAGDESLCMIATCADDGEAPLSHFERLAGRVGAWAGGVALRWQFGTGPFFAYDGHLAAQYDARQDSDHEDRPTCRPTASARC